MKTELPLRNAATYGSGVSGPCWFLSFQSCGVAISARTNRIRISAVVDVGTLVVTVAAVARVVSPGCGERDFSIQITTPLKATTTTAATTYGSDTRECAALPLAVCRATGRGGVAATAEAVEGCAEL